jgi:hypothetical protein
LRETESVRCASSSLTILSSMASSTMAPKRKPGAANHPSTSKAPPPATADVAGNTGAREGVDAAGDVAGAGGAVATSPMAEAGTGGTGEGQHQHHPNGHAPRGTYGGIIPPVPLLLTNGHSRSDDARSGVNRNPPAAPTAGATAGHAPPPGRADPATVPNGAAGPQAPPPRHHAVQTAGSQQQGRGAVATGNVRS